MICQKHGRYLLFLELKLYINFISRTRDHSFKSFFFISKEKGGAPQLAYVYAGFPESNWARGQAGAVVKADLHNDTHVKKKNPTSCVFEKLMKNHTAFIFADTPSVFEKSNFVNGDFSRT